MLPPRRGISATALALGAVGLTSTIGQLLLLRELVVVFGGNELVLGLILAVWLVLVAGGAWLAAAGSRGTQGGAEDGQTGQPLRPGALAAIAALLPIGLLLVRASRTLLGVTPGALVPLAPMLLTIVVALAPLCILLGRQFSLGARRIGSAAYVAESVGAVAGGALFAFLLVRWLDPLQTALLVGAADLAVAALLARPQASGVPAALLAACAVALLAAALPLGRWLHQTALGWQYDDLLYSRDSVYGRIAVTGTGDQRVFFENGLLFFETQGIAAEEIAHLPLLAHPDPRRVLLIGGGVQGTLAETLRHPSVEAVTYVELDPQVIAAARGQLPPAQAAALDDPRVTVVNQDGRAWVRARAPERLPGAERFDVILLGLPEPATGQINRFYTHEFFAEVHAVLSAGGVFALGVPWQENYPDPPLQRLAASIYRTLAGEFPEIALLPAGRLFLLASDSPLPGDPEVFSTRLAERRLATRWVVPSYLDYLLTTDRIAQARQLLETAEGVRLNRDLEPAAYFHGLSVWLSRLAGGLGGLEARPWHPALLAVPLLAAALLHLLRPLPQRLAVSLVIGLAGLAGMVLEVVLLLAFQVVHGNVYGQVGMLVTAYMAGLALGSAAARRRQWPAREPRRRKPRSSPRSALAWIQGGLALFALCFPPALALRPPVWAFAGLALLAGTLGGLAFPATVACLRAGQAAGAGRATGLLYGADLAGGCAGALLAGALLVPLLGIPYTCLGVALLQSAGLLLLVLRR